MPGVSHSVLTAYGPQDGTHAPTLGQVTVLLAVTILPRPLPSMRHDCPVCGRRSPEKRAKNRKTTGKRENHQPRMSLINGAVSSFFLVYCFFFLLFGGWRRLRFFFFDPPTKKGHKERGRPGPGSIFPCSTSNFTVSGRALAFSIFFGIV